MPAERRRSRFRWAKSALHAALILVLIAASSATGRADGELERLIRHDIAPMALENGAGGAAVAVYVAGAASFFNFGLAEAAEQRPITPDSLFNLASLRKLFEVTLLALAVKQGELSLDDTAADYVTELRQGSYVRGVTLGQLATHTSGLLLPTDHPPWPRYGYTRPEFLRALNAWTPDQGQTPGKQHIYSHAGFVLLQLALERRFAMPIAELMDRRIFRPLGMTSTVLPSRGADGHAELDVGLMRRAVQGYSAEGEPIGKPGDQQGYFDFPGTRQVFSTARDLARFLAAQLGELPVDPLLREAMALTRQGVFRISPRNVQALAWEINDYGGPVIIDKPGGLNNASSYVGMVTSNKLGIVILANRGNQHPYEIARHSTLPALARMLRYQIR
jgi:beta-lactamase class C